MDEDSCMVNIAQFFMNFICEESCGKCTPCREGTTRMNEILTRITQGNGRMSDIDELKSLGKMIQTSSLCGLGKTAPNPVLSTLQALPLRYLQVAGSVRDYRQVHRLHQVRPQLSGQRHHGLRTP